jgi:hypothetical protein
LSKLRLSHRPRSLFGTAVWLILGVVLFAWLYSISGPPKDVALQMAAAGPNGATSYFASPETAVREINAMLGAHEWRRLALYYDLSDSDVTERDLLNGTYFAGTTPGGGGKAMPHPFPAGYVFVSSLPTELNLMRRIIVAKSLNGTADPSAQTSFFMRRSPDGYRIIPEDAAERLRAASSAP